MKRVTLKHVAEEAKVGAATVERVLNDRGGVTQATIEKVLRAATKLGYGQRSPGLRRGAIRVEVILVRPDTPTFSRLNQSFERIAATLDKSVYLHRTFIKENDAAAMAAHILNPSFRRSGLIICSQDDPLVTESLRKVRQSGVEVVQIITQCGDPEVPYVGIDNYAAGRTAAFYMSRMQAMRKGNLVTVSHSGRYRNHRERVRGFSDYLNEQGFPGHQYTVALYGEDDDLKSAESLYEALRRDENIIGVYSAGGGDDGVAAVLKQWSANRRVFWIGHGFSEKKSGYLKSGLMDFCLDEVPETQARRALNLVLRRLNVIRTEVITEPVRFVTVNSQNV